MPSYQIYFLQIHFCYIVGFDFVVVESCQPPDWEEYQPVQTIQVKTNEGSILGKSCVTSRLKKKYYAFQGIPYAEPPKRFELSIPKKPWKEIMNCTYDKSECVQIALVQNKAVVVGSEDCLFLNVYTVNVTRKSAVIVWIHGGRFVTGSNSDGPDYFLDEDTVVVKINYRQGIFGFLSTGDLVCPGNNGLKDQVLALQWVQRNIIHFGGDPKNVTIFGQSIGSAAAALHLTSTRSRGLFKGAILSSGNSLCLWSLARRGVSTSYAIGRELGKNSTTSNSLVKHLKSVNYKTLQQTTQSVFIKVLFENPLLGVPIGPVIEIPHRTAFLTVKSDYMLSTGNFTKVPILAGLNTNELVVVAPEFFSKWNPDPRKLVPADIISDKNLTEAGLKIKSEFFGTNPVNSSAEALIQFANVDQIIRPIDRFVLDVSQHVSNTYYYMFSYLGRIREVLGINVTGVQHAEDLAYLLKNNLTYSKQDETMRLKMVRMWSNFCKFGKPTPKPDPLLGNANWLPASKSCDSGLPYLFNINSRMGQVRHPYQKQLDFYDCEIYAKYGQQVYDTY